MGRRCVSSPKECTPGAAARGVLSDCTVESIRWYEPDRQICDRLEKILSLSEEIWPEWEAGLIEEIRKAQGVRCGGMNRVLFQCRRREQGVVRLVVHQWRVQDARARTDGKDGPGNREALRLQQSRPGRASIEGVRGRSSRAQPCAPASLTSPSTSTGDTHRGSR